MRKKHHSGKKIPKNITKIAFIVFIIFLLPIIYWASQYPQLTSSEGKIDKEKISSLSVTRNSYGTIDPLDRYPANDPPPENHPDINLAVRGYIPATGKKYPLVLGEAGDPKAPKIYTILSHVPTIVSLYKIYNWDWATNKKTVPMPLPDDPGASFKQIQMVGFATNTGEEIYVPQSGYRIGGDYQVMVIFANDNSITIKYGREDNIGIKFGYAIQIEEIAVDPNLLDLYREQNAAGRGELPSLSGGQVMGVAKGNEIRVVIRDTGDFLDPRSKLDWWRGVNYPFPTDEPVIPTSLLLPATPTIFTVPTIIPTIYTSTTNIPQPTRFEPTQVVRFTPTVFIPNPQPTTYILQPSSTPTLTPTPTPSFFVTIKANWDKFFISITNLTKIILP